MSYFSELSLVGDGEFIHTPAWKRGVAGVQRMKSEATPSLDTSGMSREEIRESLAEWANALCDTNERLAAAIAWKWGVTTADLLAEYEATRRQEA